MILFLHLKTYTVEEFQERWDEMIDRVENGEHIGITNGKNTDSHDSCRGTLSCYSYYLEW